MKCRVCGRPLRDALSVARGIGPTCRAHRASVVQMSLFDEPREGEGVLYAQGGPMVSTISMVADDAKMGTGTGDSVGVLDSRPREQASQDVIDFDALRGRRAPWWRRLWAWVRGMVS